jgi:hypothetical protein
MFNKVKKFISFLTVLCTLGCKNNLFLISHDIAIDFEENIYVTAVGKCF